MNVRRLKDFYSSKLSFLGEFSEKRFEKFKIDKDFLSSNDFLSDLSTTTCVAFNFL